MTRAVVFLTVTLAAASLGVFAQDTSGSRPSQNAVSSVQISAQTTSNSATQTKAPVPQKSSVAAATQNTETSPQSAGNPATSVQTRGIQQKNGAATQDSQGSARQLPQTSTILPLLGLIGLGSLVAGLFARR